MGIYCINCTTPIAKVQAASPVTMLKTDKTSTIRKWVTSETLTRIRQLNDLENMKCIQCGFKVTSKTPAEIEYQCSEQKLDCQKYCYFSTATSHASIIEFSLNYSTVLVRLHD